MNMCMLARTGQVIHTERASRMTAAAAFTTVTLFETVHNFLTVFAGVSLMFPRFVVALRRFNRLPTTIQRVRPESTTPPFVAL